MNIVNGLLEHIEFVIGAIVVPIVLYLLNRSNNRHNEHKKTQNKLFELVDKKIDADEAEKMMDHKDEIVELKCENKRLTNEPPHNPKDR